jgi:hypothetical protein
MAQTRLADGIQRPNVVCGALTTRAGYLDAAPNYLNGTGNPSVINANCFADPGDQTPVDASRYFSSIRVDGIHNMDLSFNKQFTVHEGMTLMFPVDFFNFTNTPRCGFPDLDFGSRTLGTVPLPRAGASRSTRNSDCLPVLTNRAEQMRRRDFMKAGALGAAAAYVPPHNFDKYDFGKGPAIRNRLNQGPFPADLRTTIGRNRSDETGEMGT